MNQPVIYAASQPGRQFNLEKSLTLARTQENDLHSLHTPFPNKAQRLKHMLRIIETNRKFHGEVLCVKRL